MAIYLVTYFALFIMAFLIKERKWYVWFMCLFFSLLVGFRDLSVGADTLEYYRMYENIGTNGYHGYPEILYGYLCLFSYKIGLDFHWFQTILLFVTLLILSRQIIKYSPHYGQSIFFLYTLYLIFYTMNIYREMIACFLMMSIYPLLLYKDKKRALIYILLTIFISGIHNSAFFFLILIFMPSRKFSGFIITASIMLSFFLGLVLPNDVLAIFNRYSSLLYSDANTSHELLQSILLCVFWIIEFILISILTTTEFKKSLFYKMLFGGIIANNLLLKQGLGIRIFIYFNVLQILTIPIAINMYSKNKSINQLTMMAVISIYFLVFMFINSASVVPYAISW